MVDPKEDVEVPTRKGLDPGAGLVDELSPGVPKKLRDRISSSSIGGRSPTPAGALPACQLVDRPISSQIERRTESGTEPSEETQAFT